MTALFKTPANVSRLRFFTGVLGMLVAVSFFIWLLAGLLDWVPSMVAVFGVEGLRTPASITVGALLTAAISFWEY